MNRRISEALSSIPTEAGFDERETRILLEGVARAFSVGIYATMIAAALLALTGSGYWSAFALFAAGLPSMVINGYCRKRGIDYDRVWFGYSSAAYTIQMIISLVFLAAWIAAIAFHQLNGRPVIDIPDGVVTGGNPSGMISGAVVALAIFAIFWLVLWMKRRKMRAQQAADPADIPDED